MRVGMDRRVSPGARGEIGAALAAAVFAASFACGGARTPPPAGNAPAPSASAAADLPSDAGAPTDAAVERPFAKTPFEATQLIDKAIDLRSAELAKCVEAARGRTSQHHPPTASRSSRFALDIGIDQGGTLIGVKIPKGVPGDHALVACALAALRDAPFPRSHVGVVTVKRTFEEVPVYQ
jgi:hypothetical protein